MTDLLTDAVFIIAVALVVTGVALVSAPAAFITAGLLLGAGVVAYQRLAPPEDRNGDG